MLSYLRKKTKVIMIVVAIVFVGSMFYGLGFSGLQQMSNDKSSAFLKVNGKHVDPMRFNSIFGRLRQNFPEQISPSDLLFLQNLALSQTIDFSVMLDEARKKVRISGGDLDAAIEQVAKQQKFTNVAEFKRAIERSNMSWSNFRKMIKDEMIVQKVMGDIRNSVSVGPNDLREVRASHILITIKPGPDSDKKAKELALDLQKRIMNGEDFAALAKKYSEDPGTKSKGGDLGFFATGSMVKPFEDLAFSLKINEIGGPVKTDFGYHLIKTTDARLRKIKDKSDVEAAIRQEKQEKAFQEWFYKLKQKAKIEILDHNMKALDFRFKGKISEAIEEYNKAITANPTNAYSKLFLGMLYEDTGNAKKAIALYQEAAKIEAADPSIYLLLGKALLKNKQRADAVAQFNKASLISGDNKGMHKSLEKTFIELKMGDLAAAERAEILRIERKEAFEQGLQDKLNKIKTD